MKPNLTSIESEHESRDADVVGFFWYNPYQKGLEGRILGRIGQGGRVFVLPAGTAGPAPAGTGARPQ